MAQEGGGCIRFGDFEFRPETDELFSGGKKVTLQHKPAAILRLLLERPGQLLTRQEIAERIWAGRTVDFDQRIRSSIRQIRQALDDDSDRPICVETVPQKGYRFIAPIGDPFALDDSNSLDWRSVRRDPRRLVGWLSAAALAFVGAFGILTLITASPEGVTSTAEKARPVLVVLSGTSMSEQDRLLAEGLTDEITARLSRIGLQIMSVIAPTTAKRFTAEPESLKRAHNDLNIDYALQTMVARSQGTRQIRLNLIRLRDQTLIWSDAYLIGPKEWPRFGGNIATNIARALDLSRAQVEPADADTPANIEAFNAYLMGRSYLSQYKKNGRLKAIDYFEQAAAADNSFAPAYSALAGAYMRSADTLDRARVAVQAALKLNPNLAEAYEVSARIKLLWEKNLEAARVDIERAIALAPGRASARYWYANYLVAAGDFDRAIEQASIARQLDPLSARVSGEMGWFYLRANRPEAAITECRQALELNHHSAYEALIANDCLILAFRLLGQSEEAIAPAMDIMALYGRDDPRRQSIRNAVSTEEKLKIYWEWRVDTMSAIPGAEVDVAKAYLALGGPDRAMEILQSTLEKRSPGLVFIRYDPSWNPLRHRPDFKELVDKVFAADQR